VTDTVTAHFVTFLSPGTFVAEDTTRPIESWDVKQAMKMADDIHERHGATRSRGPEDRDHDAQDRPVPTAHARRGGPDPRQCRKEPLGGGLG
jgi:hypothetical protein